MSRSKTKTFIQPDNYSCGPASLKSSLQILGLRKSYSELFRLCKTSNRGTTLKNLIKAANKLGLSVLTTEWTTLTHLQSALKTKANQPKAIIVDYLYQDVEPWDETGHLATVSGYSSRNSRIILLDSLSGTKKSYLWTDFLDRWYDYDFKRVKAKHSIRRHSFYKKWHNRLMVVLAKDPSFLPKFKISTQKLYLP